MSATSSAPPPAAPRRRSPRRREDLVDAALESFAAKGVSATSVDDIVRRAGVAKGTFYLYFESRDDVVTAVAERLVEAVGRSIDEALGSTARTAADRLRGIAAAMGAVGVAQYERDLIATIHRPENAAIHDRLTSTISARLVPAVASTIADGIRDGEFLAQDTRQAAALVLACFTALHDLVEEPADLPAVAEHLDGFVLRGLGHRPGGAR
jgi:AcrR family transcriptional regulator